MSDRYVESAMANMGAVERLLKGLPGIRGYVDKDLRRDADKKVRDLLAAQLEEQKQALFAIQQRLLQGGGLMWMDDVDRAIQKLQILIDRVKTASYGYAGLFDPVRIREEQLDALYRFDVTLAAHAVAVENAVQQLDNAVTNNGEIGQAIQELSDVVAETNTLFNRRHEAVVSPDLLLEPAYAPQVDSRLTTGE